MLPNARQDIPITPVKLGASTHNDARCFGKIHDNSQSLCSCMEAKKRGECSCQPLRKSWAAHAPKTSSGIFLPPEGGQGRGKRLHSALDFEKAPDFQASVTQSCSDQKLQCLGYRPPCTRVPRIEFMGIMVVRHFPLDPAPRV